MKFWRDMGELIEVKRVMPNCRVVSVLFESGLKDKLVDLVSGINDGVIEVSRLKSGKKLLEAIELLAREDLPRGRDERFEFVKQSISTPLLRELSAALKTLLESEQKVWRLDKNLSVAPSEFSAINLRKAVLIAALFSTSEEFNSALPALRAIERGDPISAPSIARSLVELGICRKRIGGILISDADLIAAVRKLGADAFFEVAREALAENPESRLSSYVRMIHMLPQATPVWLSVLKNHAQDLMNPSFLASVLIENFENFALWQPQELVRPPEPWIFRRLLDLIRCIDGKHFGFGVPAFDREFLSRGMQAFRFIVSDYIAGRRCLTEEEARVAATVISRELVRVRARIANVTVEQFSEFVRRAEFNQRLMAYRGFDPLPLMIRRAERGTFHRSAPKVAAELGIAGAALCDYFQSDDMLAMWQSATEHGVAHKVNELVGRMGLICLRRSIKNGRTEFYFDKQIKKRSIFVDGSWGTSEVDALLSGCFTEVRAIA